MSNHLYTIRVGRITEEGTFSGGTKSSVAPTIIASSVAIAAKTYYQKEGATKYFDVQITNEDVNKRAYFKTNHKGQRYVRFR